MPGSALQTRIPEIVAELALIDEALVAGAHRVAQEARTRLEPHRETGELERQINVMETRREGLWVLAGDPKDPSFAFYGHMVEFGTTHSAPRPFLLPALESQAPSIVRDVALRLAAL